jgi:PhoPQ-activated pathogenicity-related protein
MEKDGTILVKAKDKPVEVKLWQITNPSARDFRLTTIGARWTSTPLNPGAQGEYSAKVASPKRGWTAYMIELTFPGVGGSGPFKFTTGVKVTPDTLPFLEESKAENKAGSQQVETKSGR